MAGEEGIQISSALGKLLTFAQEKQASDVHLTPGQEPVIRVDGRLQSLGEGADEVAKMMTELVAVKELLIPQKQGEVDFAFHVADRRYRANLYHSRGQLCGAIRLLHKETPVLAQLGLPEIVRRLARLKEGLILVTGPTSSGKSTTLAGMINAINEHLAAHIITLEDPIEYVFENKRSLIHQREVGQDVSSFHCGLRSALREDPNVIMLGEMRDQETILAAIRAAETGHLVLSTLHTMGAANTISRLIDAFPGDDKPVVRSQLSLILKGVISQRLLCGTGGKRVPVCEIMTLTDAVANQIRENKLEQITGTIQMSAGQGMITFADALKDKVRRGEIAREIAAPYLPQSAVNAGSH